MLYPILAVFLAAAWADNQIGIIHVGAHTTIAITMDTYGHATPDLQRDAVFALERLLPVQ